VRGLGSIDCEPSRVRRGKATVVKARQDGSNRGNFSKVSSNGSLQAGAMAGQTDKSRRYLRLAAANEGRAANTYNKELKTLFLRICCAVPRLGRANRRSRAVAGQTQGPTELGGVGLAVDRGEDSGPD
jgi:hypothetical protein